MISFIRDCVVIYNNFFAIYLIIYCMYQIFSNLYGSIKMFRYRRMENLQNVLEHEFYYPISIIVPAYNEGEVAVQTVENLLKLDYRLYEIVIVDDGSEDNTKDLLVDRFKLKQEMNRPIRYMVPCKPINEVYTGNKDDVLITLISKENGGCKADASNAGINIATYPYIVNMDADEILQRDALKYACRSILENDNVIGIGGNIKISNNYKFKDAMPVFGKLGRNIIVDTQIFEYGRGFIGSKIFQNKWNMNLIISGGFGIFNKAAIIEVGGYDTRSMGEDMELTLRLHQHYLKNKKKYSMKYVPDSVCWTQAPETFGDLKRQRERWHCGLIQTIAKYKSMILNPRYGAIGMFMLPYTIMYELLSPVFMLLGWIMILCSIIDSSIDGSLAVYMYLIYLMFGIGITTVSFLDKMYMKKDPFKVSDVARGLVVCIIEAIVFKPYLAIINFCAFFKMKKIASKWNSPTRVKVEYLDVK